MVSAQDSVERDAEEIIDFANGDDSDIEGLADLALVEYEQLLEDLGGDTMSSESRIELLESALRQFSFLVSRSKCHWEVSPFHGVNYPNFQTVSALLGPLSVYITML